MPSLEAESIEGQIAPIASPEQIKDNKKPSVIISSAPEDPKDREMQFELIGSKQASILGNTGPQSREKSGIQQFESPENEGSTLLLVPRQSVLKSITRYGTGSDATAQGSAETELYSKKSFVRFIEGDVAMQDLEESKRMNKVSSKCEEVLRDLKELKPEEISEIRELYDPSVEVSGPWIHSMTQSTYVGQCRSMTPHGWGRLITRKGEVIDAFFQNGVITRYAQIVFADGTWYRGGFDKKLKNGLGTYVDKFGLSTECSWVNGEAAGPTIIRDRKGRILFEGSIERGMRERSGRFYDRVNKFEYKGNFLNDQFQGHGRKQYENGVVYEGNFTEGIESGEGEITFVDGRRYIGTFVLGKPHGSGSLITDYGEVRLVKYANGQLVR